MRGDEDNILHRAHYKPFSHAKPVYRVGRWCRSDQNRYKHGATNTGTRTS